MIWVHQLKGKDCFNDAPGATGYRSQFHEYATLIRATEGTDIDPLEFMEVKSDFPMKFGSPGTNLVKFIYVLKPLHTIIVLYQLNSQRYIFCTRLLTFFIKDLFINLICFNFAKQQLFDMNTKHTKIVITNPPAKLIEFVKKAQACKEQRKQELMEKRCPSYSIQ